MSSSSVTTVSRIQNAFFQVKQPTAVLLRLQPALQLVGQPRDRTLQGVQLLVEIGAQAFQLGRFGKFFGLDFLIEISGIDSIVGVGIGMRSRRRRLQRRFALGQFGLVALLHVGAVFHGDLRLGLVLLFVLRLLGAGLAVLALLLVLAGGVRRILILLGVVAQLILIGAVGVVAQLVAIAKIGNHLARQTGEGRLIGKRMVDVFQGAASLLFDEPAPEVHDVLRALGQVAARCQMTHQIARSDGQGRILRAGDLGIALAVGLMPDLGVDIAGGARHVTRAHRLAAGGFHRVVDVAGQLAGGRVAGGNAVVVILPVQREGIGGAARQQHLIPRHPAADLRQPHAFLVHSRRINGI